MDANVKIAASQVAVIAARGAATIREQATKIASLSAQNEQLTAKLAARDRSDEVMAIARDMEEKNLNESMTFDEKVAAVASYPDLNTVRESVKMASSRSELVIARATNAPGRGKMDALTAFCVSGAEN